MRIFQKLNEDGSVLETVHTASNGPEDTHGTDYAQRLLADGYVEVVADDKPALTLAPEPQPEAGEPVAAPAATESEPEAGEPAAPVAEPEATSEAEQPKALKVKPARVVDPVVEQIVAAALKVAEDADMDTVSAALSDVQSAMVNHPDEPSLKDAEAKLQDRQKALMESQA